MNQKLSIIIGLFCLIFFPFSLTGSQKANQALFSTISSQNGHDLSKKVDKAKARKLLKQYRKDNKAESKNNPRRNAEDAKLLGILSLVFLVIFMPVSIVLAIITIEKANRGSDFRLYQDYNEIDRADILNNFSLAKKYAIAALIVVGALAIFGLVLLAIFFSWW